MKVLGDIIVLGGLELDVDIVVEGSIIFIRSEDNKRRLRAFAENLARMEEARSGSVTINNDGSITVPKGAKL